MSKIKILPEILSNKIAAGEVVERPASVVKELVENSLDANSTRIIIEVEKGGRSLIRISDNGIGMSHDDALLAIERYATSKIYTDSDLFSINTLGFRGEALPSIASVSCFVIETNDGNDEAGTRIDIKGGIIKKVSEIGAPRGTLIIVQHLFFNTPVRRKFLKTINTEMGHIADTVANIALGWPDVRFSLLHNGKKVKDWVAASDPGDRVADVLGKDIRNNLHRIVPHRTGGVSLSGWVASPQVTRSTSRGIYIYVNGRCVRDRTVQHALFEGFAGRLMKGQFPMAVLFINVPADEVDVNVHPRKNEIRFLEGNKIHGVVAEAVSGALNLADRPVSPCFQEQDSEQHTAGKQDQEPGQPCVSESAPHFSASGKGHALPSEKESSQSVKNGIFQENRPSPAEQTTLWKKKQFGDLRVIGQFSGTYILCESEKELVLIDQHAAHERILFEQLKNRGSKGTSQRLLIPETIDVSYSEANLLEKLIPHFQETGLEIEPFGGNTFVVKSVPAILGHREIRPLIIEIAEKMAETGFNSGLEDAMDACLSLMACHGAIRANQQLSDEQIKQLLNQLEECENPFHCPHGRPLQIRWSLQSLEKSFKRIV